MVSIQKNDFIEIVFTGKIKDTGAIFDTNSKEEIEKRNLNFEPKPYIVCVGRGMTIKGLDDDLVGKEVNQKYCSEFNAESAFGKRNSELIKMVPLKFFVGQKIMPQKGMQLNIDGSIVRVVSVSGGRVLVDFNNPLAGKTVVYDYKILRKIEEEKEKINALQDFFFRKRFDFEIRGEEVFFKVEKVMEKFIDMMAKPFEEILGIKIKTEIIEQKPKIVSEIDNSSENNST